MPERKFRRFHHLTYGDRLKIEQMHAGGAGIREIADALRVNYTTVYRELKRPGVMYGHLNSDYTTTLRYSADIAQTQYEYNISGSGRPIKLGNDYEFANYIEDKIIKGKRSPDAALMDISLEDRSFKTSVCTKTIYNYIEHGVFLNLTKKNLPEKGHRARKYGRVTAKQPPRGESIDKRPESVNRREEFGHWEMDTVKGRINSKKALLALTERVTREEIVVPVYGATKQNVVDALNKIEKKFGVYYSRIFRSITVDNGSEFADREGMERSINGGKRTKIYYCHPYSPYERGSNENQNRMLRRIFPKGTDFDKINDAEIYAAADWLNNYPRRKIGNITANMLFNQHLAQIIA